MLDIEEKPAVEYLDGRAYRKVSPRIAHAVAQSNLCAIARGCVGDRGVVGTELHVYPGRVDGTDTVLVPDVAIVTWERVDAARRIGEEPRSPDVAIEVRSPSNDLHYRERKIERYLSTGTLLVLDVDPESRAIVAHDGDGVERFECGQRLRRASVPWLEFDVDEAFRDIDRATQYER